MVKLTFISSFRLALGGKDELEIDAASIRELFTLLVSQYPGMQAHIDEGVAVAINGEIYRDNWNTAIPDGSDVFLMPRIQGG